MNTVKNFNELSYERHKTHLEESFDEKKLATWKNKKTIDFWRHEKMYTNLDPLLEAYPKANWLTVGDGRYGTDANYIESKGDVNVLATDIADTYLKIAYEEGFISKYKLENAEALSFKDDSFDFVLCKEAYHHFPRPMIALYEMLRVAKKSVILMEPQDRNILVPYKAKIISLLRGIVQTSKNYIKTKIGKQPYYDYGGYEEVGNYIYSISKREIEKVALGLNYSMVSFKDMNDYYTPGVEYEEVNEKSALYQKVKKNIEDSDRKSALGIQSAGLLVAIIHKTAPDEAFLKKLSAVGFENRALSRNPYL